MNSVEKPTEDSTKNKETVRKVTKNNQMQRKRNDKNEGKNTKLSKISKK